MVPVVSLENVTVSTIKPFTKTEHPAIIEPSVFDLFVMDTYIPILFFYKSQKGVQGSSLNLVDNLKVSLSKVLVPYFPVAGRWVRTYDARIRELECNDEGVPFIEASIDEELESVVSFKDFEPVELLGGHQFMGLDAKAFHQNVEFPLPALFVQVTHFKCGSVALHIAFSHQAFDAEGVFTFLSAWSEVALRGHTSIVPVHDRSLTTSFSEFIRSSGSGEAGEHVSSDGNGNCSSDGNGNYVNVSETTRVDPGAALKFPTKPTRNKTLHVKRQVIEDLKREAAQKNMQVTTVDLITAHVWRSLNSLPQSLDDGKTSPPNLAIMVNGRNRFHNPPLPANYTGNAVMAFFTPPTPALELASDSPLCAANILHNTIKAINSSTWKKCLSDSSQIINDFHQLNYRLMFISSWFRNPMYEIDFGHGFGNPTFVSMNFVCGFAPCGAVVILPPLPALSDVATATVQFICNDAAQALLSDEDFLRFFI